MKTYTHLKTLLLRLTREEELELEGRLARGRAGLTLVDRLRRENYLGDGTDTTLYLILENILTRISAIEAGLDRLGDELQALRYPPPNIPPPHLSQ